MKKIKKNFMCICVLATLACFVLNSVVNPAWSTKYNKIQRFYTLVLFYKKHILFDKHLIDNIYDLNFS